LRSVDVNAAAPLVVDLQRSVTSGEVLTAFGYRSSKPVVSKRVTA